MFWTSQTLTGLDGTGKQCILHVPGGITRESDGQSGVSCCFPSYLFVIHLYHLQNGLSSFQKHGTASKNHAHGLYGQTITSRCMTYILCHPQTL